MLHFHHIAEHGPAWEKPPLAGGDRWGQQRLPAQAVSASQQPIGSVANAEGARFLHRVAVLPLRVDVGGGLGEAAQQGLIEGGYPWVGGAEGASFEELAQSVDDINAQVAKQLPRLVGDPVRARPRRARHPYGSCNIAPAEAPVVFRLLEVDTAARARDSQPSGHSFRVDVGVAEDPAPVGPEHLRHGRGVGRGLAVGVHHGGEQDRLRAPQQARETDGNGRAPPR